MHYEGKNPTEIEVEVTQDDIENGVARDCNRCPIALALRRQFPHCLNVVDNETVSILFPYEELIYQLPNEAQVFIERFDYSLDPIIQPIKFKMSIYKEE